MCFTEDYQTRIRRKVGGRLLEYLVAKNPNERMSRQAVDTFNDVRDKVKHGDMIQAFNRKHISGDICPTLTTRPEGFKTATLVVENINIKRGDGTVNAASSERKTYEQHFFTYASLFSGIGGFEQALNKFGGHCVFASEIDKFAAKAYETLYGHKPTGDITKIPAEDIPEHDLLVGGFPYS